LVDAPELQPLLLIRWVVNRFRARRSFLSSDTTPRSSFSTRFLFCLQRFGLPSDLVPPSFVTDSSCGTGSLACTIIDMALQFGHVTRTPRRVTTLSAVVCARNSKRHARQKVWVQGRLTGWSKGSRQMVHFGTVVEVSGSALAERLDPLAAVARLRRLGMARGSRHPLIASCLGSSFCVYKPAHWPGERPGSRDKPGDATGVSSGVGLDAAAAAAPAQWPRGARSTQTCLQCPVLPVLETPCGWRHWHSGSSSSTNNGPLSWRLSSIVLKLPKATSAAAVDAVSPPHEVEGRFWYHSAWPWRRG
jgi:hypothetical protein